MVLRFVLAAALVLSAASCRGGADTHQKPAGTPSDPVETCERAAEVCRLEGAKLGVCVQAAPGTESCADKKNCLVCQSQH